MEELVNENQPAPKVEKISLAELRAETEKLNEQEKKYHEEQKRLEDEFRAKKKQKNQEDEKAVEDFFNTLKNASPEVLAEFTKLVENGEIDD